MACDECRALTAHEFRGADDMVHAFQVAAAELERGVLRRLDREPQTVAERDAVYSALESGLPGYARYRFECTTCGERFELWANVPEGRGGWARE